MAGKRIRQPVDEQQTIRPRRQAEGERQKSSAGDSQLNRLDDPAGVVQLQQTYGNAYVQRRLSQQEMSQQQAKKNLFSFETKAQLSGGLLGLDIAQALNLKRYVQSRQSQEKPSRWQGIGCLQVGGREFADKNVLLQTDGRLRLTAGRPFVEQVAQVAQSSYAHALAGLARPVSANVKVTLHTHPDDLELRDSQLPGRDTFLAESQKKATPFFLKVEIESVFVVMKEGKGQEIKLEGQALLGSVIGD